MRNWNKLGHEGKLLRETIRQGNDSVESCVKTLKALAACYKKLADSFFINEFEEIGGKGLLLSVQADIELLSESNWREKLNDLAPIDLVNDELREFYDFCDTYDPWINL